MKTIISRTRGKAFRSAFVLGAVALLGLSQATFAQEGKKALLSENTEKTATVSGELRAVVYPSIHPLKLKVNFENPAKERISLSIRNSNGNIVYTTVVGRDHIFNGKYDLSSLPDGNYTMELHGKSSRYTQSFQIRTETERLALVQ